MQDFEVNVADLRDHASAVGNLAGDVHTMSGEISSASADQAQMYGMFVGPMVCAGLSVMLLSAEKMVDRVADLVEGIGGNLSGTADDYQQTEEANVAEAKNIQDMLSGIGGARA
ncbi:hypothetical protein HMPREF1531_01230 [Propionibacterium sp. oral taxon 192 str. F0372]|uniref:hypothetical protein n=1 Tax=Propionibacterium sp. oral taxon 192 TaxID=671222 RepID=UPI000353EC23|nr:hypothetical protein [Propionibacterium sp. oral taxon 192]EPH03804.1 hypothetical protein HMPREF1531_01230 [Propionibacterium sp. oral taxon 192 str. F0372]